MYGKIIISCNLKVLTGMHIGGSSAFSAIGAVDSPVITDSVSGMPIIPGSSLKGKMRTLLSRSLSKDNVQCKINDDNIKVKRLFGATDPVIYSRLQFSDCFLKNRDELPEHKVTEIKTENNIDRVTSVANPRQIERVVSGAIFSVNITYDIIEENELYDDMKSIAQAMKLLQLDYLGGHGTRGSGRISFSNITITPKLISENDINIIEIKSSFEEIENYELLSI